MFKYPGTEVYNEHGAYRVVFSVEEFGQALVDGWLIENPVPFTDLLREVIAPRPTPGTPKPVKSKPAKKAEQLGEAVIQSTEPETA